jgi:hypothetical protein
MPFANQDCPADETGVPGVKRDFDKSKTVDAR